MPESAPQPFTYTPARRERVPVLLGLTGPSGGGKTYSALRVATGMGGEIGFIDTEGRRALHYADKFAFNHVPFEAPFTSGRYLEAINFTIGQGAKNVIVDSMSHEHEGQGGHLQQHEAEVDRMARGDDNKREKVKWAAWIKPKQERRDFLNALLQVGGVNFIFCFRAKEKTALVKIGGKLTPVPRGWQAIAGEEFVFEMTARCVLPPGCNGVPDWSEETVRQGAPKMTEDLRAVFKSGRVLDEGVGKELAAWALGGATDSTPITTIADGEAVAAKGTAALQTWWGTLPGPARKALAGEKDRLKALADAVDQRG